jgi:DNA-binding MarR family transcriptional regulator
MKSENQAVINELVGSLRKLVRAVYLDSQKMSRRFGLTGPQSAVLRLLVNYGSMSSAEVSRRLYVTPSNVTGIIDRLQKKGYVARNRKEGDRRVALITLTESGRQLSQTIPDPIEKKLIAALADLEPQHVQILGMAMQQVIDLIDTEDVEATPMELSMDHLQKNT